MDDACHLSRVNTSEMGHASPRIVNRERIKKKHKSVSLQHNTLTAIAAGCSNCLTKQAQNNVFHEHHLSVIRRRFGCARITYSCWFKFVFLRQLQDIRPKLYTHVVYKSFMMMYIEIQHM